MVQVLTKSLTQLVLQLTQLEENLSGFQARVAQLELAEDTLTLQLELLQRTLQYLPPEMQAEVAAVENATPEVVRARLQELRALPASLHTVEVKTPSEGTIYVPRKASAVHKEPDNGN